MCTVCTVSPQNSSWRDKNKEIKEIKKGVLSKMHLNALITEESVLQIKNLFYSQKIQVKSHPVVHKNGWGWSPTLLLCPFEQSLQTERQYYIGVGGQYNLWPNLSHPGEKKRCIWNSDNHITWTTDLFIHTQTSSWNMFCLFFSIITLFCSASWSNLSGLGWK